MSRNNKPESLFKTSDLLLGDFWCVTSPPELCHACLTTSTAEDSPDTVPGYNDLQPKRHTLLYRMASAAARERYARKNEAADLKRAFNALDTKGDGKIDPEELNQVFQTLGHKPRRGEVEDLIWEVDEDCDGNISWHEFQRMYHRCRQDSTGYEPRGLFNVCEFVMNDKESSGSISLEEALQIMYLRHGRAELDAKLEEVFGTSDLNSGKTLSLTEFLSCLHQHQVKQLLNKATSKNYKPAGTAGGSIAAGVATS